MDTSRARALFSGCMELVFSGVTLGLAIGAAGIFFLARGLEARSAIAYVIVGSLVTLILLSAGVGLTLAIVGFAHWLQSRYAAQERQRDLDNIKENAGIMLTMQRVQNTQNSMLLRQAREAQRLLPGPADRGEMIDYEDAMFFDDLADVEGE